MSEYIEIKRSLYNAYVMSMKIYGKKPLSYREWFRQVQKVKVGK